MWFDPQEKEQFEAQVQAIVNHVVDVGEVGFIAWDIKANKFDVNEKILGLQIKDCQSLPEFINKFVLKKDREIAQQDLEMFLNRESDYYQSTYRIEDYTGKVRWIFCKGIMKGNILGAIMYDVTSDKFMRGHDQTTNLIDGRIFLRKLNNALQYACQHGTKGALLYIEIANFMTIINKYGFQFSADVLYKFSRLLLDFIGDDEELARFPYDKFMMMVHDTHTMDEIEQFGQKIIDVFDKPLLINGVKINLNLNIGIAVFPDAGMDADDLMRYSDFAVRHSRKIGDNTCTYFDEEMLKTYYREMHIESELANAIANNELLLVYQPQLDVQKNRITGFEALIRWDNPRLGLVSPAEFIPIAEDKGYIVSIGRWSFNQMMKTARKWLDDGFEIDSIGINVSPIEFQQKDFKKRLLEKCRKHGVPPHLIELEITERCLMATNEANICLINSLIAEGFKIALDDFGTGNSNINFLLNFNITTLKLDKTLVDSVNDKRRQYLVQYIIASQKHMEYEIVAEGVESQEVVDTLLELGCERIQGYYVSKPLTENEAEKFYITFNENKNKQ